VVVQSLGPQYMDSQNPTHWHTMRTLERLVDIYDLAATNGVFHNDTDSMAMLPLVQELQAQ